MRKPGPPLRVRPLTATEHSCPEVTTINVPERDSIIPAMECVKQKRTDEGRHPVQCRFRAPVVRLEVHVGDRQVADDLLNALVVFVANHSTLAVRILSSNSTRD